MHPDCLIRLDSQSKQKNLLPENEIDKLVLNIGEATYLSEQS